MTLNCRLPERPLRWAGYHELAGHVPFSYASLRAGRADIANAFYVTDAVAAARWAAATGRPAVFTVTGIPREDVTRGRRLRLRAWRYAISRSAAVVALSQGAAQGLAWLGVEPTVIHPGVDLGTFRRSSERSPTPLVFCPAAIDDPRKRIGLLVEALESLPASHPHLRLVLTAPAHRSAEKLLPADRSWIELRPIITDAALVQAYSEAWVTVLPSRLEAFGLTLVESLACGTPVVGAREGGVPEIVDREGIGRLFRPDDRDDLAQAVEEALDLAGEPSIPAACRERAADFSNHRQVAAYLALYDQLV